MKQILAFAGSNSSTSINHSLVKYICTRIDNQQVELIKLTDYPLPMFSVDLEKNQGYPEPLKELLQKIKSADALIISVNEHNRNVSAFFKNVLDWLSRLEYKFLQDKKILLTSTSTGKRGGISSNQYVEAVVPRFNGEVVVTFTFPAFKENFSRETNTVTDQAISENLDRVIATFLDEI